MKKFTISLKIAAYALLCTVFLSFSAYGPTEEEAVYVQQKLYDHYNAEAKGGLIKKYELHVTNTGFCRYKCFFNNGKIEYFSFNFLKYKDIDYAGTSQSGTLILRTKGDDVIVQTYNDSKGGDIDSMATFMAIPLKNIEPEELNQLMEKFQQMSSKLRQ
ncbi:hypothetical protein HDF26_003418 [Pedobacter cryoconitis]|uniref:Uncharacterized protein n=1 Tax=Pedobacter cryoconitis TaxID=188932 RepID=A0A7W8ZLN8_9SPHI|nr:hypothetical protein [Pedobacter cryoconitis]MBB5636120.1 hypothetical protein [Pedobacter cryoconitis]MBB6272958.1 hypothetical protein [Pedobacter cryoconitis]